MKSSKPSDTGSAIIEQQRLMAKFCADEIYGVCNLLESRFDERAAFMIKTDVEVHALEKQQPGGPSRETPANRFNRLLESAHLSVRNMLEKIDLCKEFAMSETFETNHPLVLRLDNFQTLLQAVHGNELNEIGDFSRRLIEESSDLQITHYIFKAMILPTSCAVVNDIQLIAQLDEVSKSFLKESDLRKEINKLQEQGASEKLTEADMEAAAIRIQRLLLEVTNVSQLNAAMRTDGFEFYLTPGRQQLFDTITNLFPGNVDAHKFFQGQVSKEAARIKGIITFLPATETEKKCYFVKDVTFNIFNRWEYTYFPPITRINKAIKNDSRGVVFRQQAREDDEWQKVKKRQVELDDILAAKQFPGFTYQDRPLNNLDTEKFTDGFEALSSCITAYSMRSEKLPTMIQASYNYIHAQLYDAEKFQDIFSAFNAPFQMRSKNEKGDIFMIKPTKDTTYIDNDKTEQKWAQDYQYYVNRFYDKFKEIKTDMENLTGNCNTLMSALRDLPIMKRLEEFTYFTRFVYGNGILISKLRAEFNEFSQRIGQAVDVEEMYSGKPTSAGKEALQKMTFSYKYDIETLFYYIRTEGKSAKMVCEMYGNSELDMYLKTKIEPKNPTNFALTTLYDYQVLLPLTLACTDCKSSNKRKHSLLIVAEAGMGKSNMFYYIAKSLQKLGNGVTYIFCDNNMLELYYEYNNYCIVSERAIQQAPLAELNHNRVLCFENPVLKQKNSDTRLTMPQLQYSQIQTFKQNLESTSKDITRLNSLTSIFFNTLHRTESQRVLLKAIDPDEERAEGMFKDLENEKRGKFGSFNRIREEIGPSNLSIIVVFYLFILINVVERIDLRSFICRQSEPWFVRFRDDFNVEYPKQIQAFYEEIKNSYQNAPSPEKEKAKKRVEQVLPDLTNNADGDIFAKFFDHGPSFANSKAAVRKSLPSVAFSTKAPKERINLLEPKQHGKYVMMIFIKFATKNPDVFLKERVFDEIQSCRCIKQEHIQKGYDMDYNFATNDQANTRSTVPGEKIWYLAVLLTIGRDESYLTHKEQRAHFANILMNSTKAGFRVWSDKYMVDFTGGAPPSIEKTGEEVKTFGDISVSLQANFQALEACLRNRGFLEQQAQTSSRPKSNIYLTQDNSWNEALTELLKDYSPNKDDLKTTLEKDLEDKSVVFIPYKSPHLNTYIECIKRRAEAVEGRTFNLIFDEVDIVYDDIKDKGTESQYSKLQTLMQSDKVSDLLGLTATSDLIDPCFTENPDFEKFVTMPNTLKEAAHRLLNLPQKYLDVYQIPPVLQESYEFKYHPTRFTRESKIAGMVSNSAEAISHSLIELLYNHYGRGDDGRNMECSVLSFVPSTEELEKYINCFNDLRDLGKQMSMIVPDSNTDSPTNTTITIGRIQDDIFIPGEFTSRSFIIEEIQATNIRRTRNMNRVKVIFLKGKDDNASMLETLKRQAENLNFPDEPMIPVLCFVSADFFTRGHNFKNFRSLLKFGRVVTDGNAWQENMQINGRIRRVRSQENFTKTKKGVIYKWWAHKDDTVERELSRTLGRPPSGQEVLDRQRELTRAALQEELGIVPSDEQVNEERKLREFRWYIEAEHLVNKCIRYDKFRNDMALREPLVLLMLSMLDRNKPTLQSFIQTRLDNMPAAKTAAITEQVESLTLVPEEAEYISMDDVEEDDTILARHMSTSDHKPYKGESLESAEPTLNIARKRGADREGGESKRQFVVLSGGDDGKEGGMSERAERLLIDTSQSLLRFFAQ